MIEDLLEHAAAAKDRFDLWGRVVRGCGATGMAEIGVWQGVFAAAMLRSCPGLERYLLVDPWRPLDDWAKPLNGSADRFEAARRTALAAVAFAGARVVEARGTTGEVEASIPDASLDVVYVDGDHTLRGITTDLIRLLPKVRVGGLLGGDDFHDDPWHHGTAHEPTLVNPLAVHFAEAMDLPIVLLPYRQFAIRNTPGRFSLTNVSGVPYRGRVGIPSSLLQRTFGRVRRGLMRRRPAKRRG